MKKIVQTKTQKGKIPISIQTSQKSIWEFWGMKDNMKVTSSKNFDTDTYLWIYFPGEIFWNIRFEIFIQ